MVPVIPHPDRERTHVPYVYVCNFPNGYQLRWRSGTLPLPYTESFRHFFKPRIFCTFVVEKQTKEYEPNESDTHIYPSIIVDLL